MKKNLIVISKDGEIETWSTLTAACRCHADFSYHYLKTMKFPFDYKGWKFEKKDMNTCSINK